MLNFIYFQLFRYVLSSAREGRLELILPGGRKLLFGDSASEPIIVRVSDSGFFKKVIRDAGIGLGESYTAGMWHTETLTRFLDFLIQNKKYFDARLAWFKSAGHFFNVLQHRGRENSVENSAKNIEAHYDLSNEFFSLFLDPTMTYSSAVFQGTADENLEAAQRYKIKLLAQKTGIKNGEHVLEIGSGWGAFAIQTVRETGCQWTGLTLSKEQKKWADEKIKEAGLSDAVQIQLTDYRHAQGSYERVISVEMIEAVGHEYLPVYFESCARLLKKGGRMGLQAIVIPQERYESYRKSCDWIQKHIFPGGHLPSLELIAGLSSKAGLVPSPAQSIGKDYAKTLALWCAALLAQREKLIRMGYDDAFIRKWQYYFCYCEAGFSAGLIDAVQIVLDKPI